MRICCILMLTVCSVGAVAVLVTVDSGQNVTLNCSSRVGLSSCWSRGQLPSTGMCGDSALVWWDGHRVKERRSERYLMEGAVPGDVSLTILDLRTEDTGTYGCRVDLPWELDHKQHYNLQVRPAEARSSAAPLFTSLPSSTADHMTLRHMTSAHVTSASPQIWTSSSGRRAEEKTRRTVLMMSLLPLLFFISAAIIILISVRKRHCFQKMSESLSPVQISSSTLHLQERPEREENIYN